MISSVRIKLQEDGTYEAILFTDENGGRIIKSDTLEGVLKEIQECQVQEQK